MIEFNDLHAIKQEGADLMKINREGVGEERRRIQSTKEVHRRRIYINKDVAEKKKKKRNNKCQAAGAEDKMLRLLLQKGEGKRNTMQIRKLRPGKCRPPYMSCARRWHLMSLLVGMHLVLQARETPMSKTIHPYIYIYIYSLCLGHIIQ